MSHKTSHAGERRESAAESQIKPPFFFLQYLSKITFLIFFYVMNFFFVS